MAAGKSSDTFTTQQLIATFHSELGTANACIGELELANAARDTKRALVGVLRLHHAWSVAEAAGHMLDKRGALVRPNLAARAALAASRYFAREVLAHTWQLLVPDLRSWIETSRGGSDPQPSITHSGNTLKALDD